MTKEHKVLAALALLAGVFYWFNLELPAALVGVAMTAYAVRDTFRSAN